ncbi:alpha-L-fucosidase [Lacticaseibacillus parakribbianus]|uniref:alpha-L-fucosidase n=1 Tax=Lacticaseibacillus parakribbianus TaxID=2970927 RepID=UPI0021CAEB2D|nr:alpha-L-fucosidase [Lacticaseibacillus parakribbianus]
MAHTFKEIQAVNAAGRYHADWASIGQHPAPDWFRQAKFGIFTHWGVYTVPEYSNEWYSRNMYIKGYPAFEHHVATYGPQKVFGYKDLIPLFSAKQFDATQWLDLFQQAGAKYYFPVAEHHDGFQMYRSALSHWNAYEMGPHRDVLGELRQATLDHGLHFALSNHRAEHWWFMGHGREFDSDVHEPLHKGDFYWPAAPEPDNQDLFSKPYPTAEFLEDWVERVCELIDNYRPELLYFDWWLQHAAFKPYMQELAAYYYNRAVEWGSAVSICYKYDGMAWGAGIPDVERGGFAQPTPFYWQTDTAIANNSWCYTDSLDYKSVNEVLISLLDAVAKNGNLLLNVGPRADGSIAPKDQEILKAIGAWLAVNGEGIYGSLPWKRFGEGPTNLSGGMFEDLSALHYGQQDFRYTANHGAVYAYALAPGAATELVLTAFRAFDESNQPQFHGVIRGVSQLGGGPVDWHVEADGMHVTIRPSADNRPVGLKITME